MNIYVAKTSGFCAGVKNTVINTEKELEKNNTIYCLGELIHNKQVIESLENKGLKIIDSIDEAQDKVIIRAHGVRKAIYEYADKHNIVLLDFTCPKVLKIHNQVQDFANNNYFIFLFGIKNHPETIGTYSFCGINKYLIESPDDIPSAIEKLNKSNIKNVLIISQTTFSLSLFDTLKNMIMDSLGNNFNIHVENSICNATYLRQTEAMELSSKVDLMIVIGGKNSSNTKKLYDVSCENCENVVHIQTKDELDGNFVKSFQKIGIIAGASTPDYIIEDVVHFCKTL